MKIDNKIIVKPYDQNNATLYFKRANLTCHAFIGKNGVTQNKTEGDGKTPIGTFDLGFILTTHDAIDINSDYTKITQNMYMICNPNSNLYNQIIYSDKIQVKWQNYEHLIEYPIQYEYLIEIKSNPLNLPNKGSGIFLHCERGVATEGCVAIKNDDMLTILKNLTPDTKIEIQDLCQCL